MMAPLRSLPMPLQACDGGELPRHGSDLRVYRSLSVNCRRLLEREIEGEPIPELVQLPLTINGRIFPRQDRDVWSFDATAGQLITCEVTAARILSPLDSRLTLFAPDGSVLAIDDDTCGRDSRIRFKAVKSGRYQLQIEDADQGGLQRYICASHDQIRRRRTGNLSPRRPPWRCTVC
ncbi:MAG UNVERIFIED_CONTAM: PPC domain-containing protein [Planctomycetaceae bacterium]|jgi:hypothetical protein